MSNIDSEIRLVRHWQDTCSVRCAEQADAARYMRRCSIGTSVAVILLSSTSSVAGTVKGIGASDTHDPWVVLLMTVLGWLATVLMSANHFMDFAKRAQEHLTSSHSYDNLYRDIRTLLAITSKPTAAAVTDMEQKMNKIELVTPSLPPRCGGGGGAGGCAGGCNRATAAAAPPLPGGTYVH